MHREGTENFLDPPKNKKEDGNRPGSSDKSISNGKRAEKPCVSPPSFYTSICVWCNPMNRVSLSQSIDRRFKSDHRLPKKPFRSLRTAFRCPILVAILDRIDYIFFRLGQIPTL